MVCEECGINLSARPKHAWKYLRKQKRFVEYDPIFYYTCARKPKVGGFRCNSKTHHRAQLIDELVWQKVSAIVKNPRLLQEKHAEFISGDAIKRRTAQILALKGSHEEELLKLERRACELSALLGEARMDEEEFRAAKNANQKRREDVLAQVASVSTGIAALEAQADSSALLEVAKELAGVVDDANFEQRREIVQALVSKILVSSSGDITVTVKGGLALEV
ncbi:MAG: zinc ribbon domain-containing protein [Bdellovibrionaceae bacterium]|nr:zinc ribbon domain-containing protein [Pseudobdellovibrionaceae bacterium]